MQKSIDAGTHTQKQQLMLAIASHTLQFVKNPFANYVVQFILRMRVERISAIVNQALISDLVGLSMQKFSSNVIEKCLEYNSEVMNKGVVTELIKDSQQLMSLLSDIYGNYVV
jgi:Pumilio-family RNA binding repeat